MANYNYSSNTTIPNYNSDDSYDIQSLLTCMSHLPAQDTSAFYQAQHLLLTESHPSYFATCTQQSKSSSQSASSQSQSSSSLQQLYETATRIAAYWTARRKIFGDPAFLQAPLAPLAACTGSSQQQHIITKLNETDVRGRPLVWLDANQLARDPDALLASLFSCCHYALVKDAQQKHQSAPEMVGIGYFTARDLLSNQQQCLSLKSALELLQEVFPIGIHALHICVVDENDSNNSPPVEATLATLQQRLRRFQSLPLHYHVTRSVGGIVERLSACGIQPSCFPKHVKEELEAEQATASTRQQQQIPVRATATAVPSLKRTRDSAAAAVEGPVSLALLPKNSIVQGSTATAATTATSATEGIPFIETPQTQEEGLRRLKEALDMLPDESKAAYLAALESAPHLISLESNPLRFLRFAKYNAWAAAQQIATYWRRRLAVFGDRAFLPLTLDLSYDNSSALNDEDVVSIQSGYFSFLPNDAYGRTVIYYDPSRRVTQAADSRKRTGFYYWSLICENNASISHGFVAVVLLGMNGGKLGGGPSLDATIKECVDIVVESFPTSPGAFHLVNCPSGFGQRLFYEGLLPLTVRLMSRMLNERTLVHVGEKEELLRKLSEHGLRPEHLPDSIGGAWSYECHAQWVQDRFRFEATRYGPYSSRLSIKPTKITRPDLPLDVSVVDDTDSAQFALAMEAVPLDNKSDYLEAMRQCPDLVDKESCTSMFLRCEQGNFSRAAQRLARYWKVRREAFGEKAFLSLCQTGDGCLERKDLSVLGTTYLMSLPKDSAGRAVLFCDGTRLSKSTKQSRLRCTFYMYSIVAEVVKSQTEGIVLLYVATEPSFDRANRECLELVLSAVPCFVYNVHLLSYADDSSDAVPVTDKMDNDALEHLKAISRNEFVAHDNLSKADTVRILSSHGLYPAGLPKAIGGGYGFNEFSEWHELRLRFEWDLPAGASNKQAATLFDFSKAKQLLDMTEEEKVDRKRKLNVIHSRRKRERERIEIEVLKEQSTELNEEKAMLRKEEVRLQNLLGQAQSLVRSRQQ
jgi:hypothetical protein